MRLRRYCIPAANHAQVNQWPATAAYAKLQGFPSPPLSLAILAATLLGLAVPPQAAASPPSAKSSLGFDPWDAGAPGELEIQVQRLDDDTFVLRQSLRTNFEGPFLYLLFGRDRALLLDTGAGGLRIRPSVDRLIEDWRRTHANRRIQLVVAHSHGHRDHIAGDSEFSARPDTTVVGLSTPEVARFFQISSWPTSIGRLDLGGRVLSIIPTPGISMPTLWCSILA